MDVLVSDRGEILDRHSLTLSRLMPVDNPLANPARFAVETLGFAHFSRRASGLIHLRLNRDKLSRTCFTKLVWLLTDMEATRVVLEDESLGGLVEIFQNFHEIVARLDSLRICQDGEQSRPDFQTIHLSLDRLGHPKRHILNKTLQYWQDKKRIFNHPPTNIMPDAFVDDSFILKLTNETKITIEHWPKVMKLYRPCDHIAMIGQDICHQPDPLFAARAAQRPRTTLRDQMPVLELVEAVIRAPGLPTRRHRYERLVLPWRDLHNCPYITETIFVRSIRTQ